MSTLIPRLHKEADKTYQELISEETDIKEMKQEILLSVEKALEEARFPPNLHLSFLE